MKSNILITAAFTVLSFFLPAQDKYQFLVIEYSTMDGKIAVSIDGLEFQKSKVDYDKHDKSGFNANPILEKVNEFQDKDWELMSFNTQIAGRTMPGTNPVTYNDQEIWFAYMRKKKK